MTEPEVSYILRDSLFVERCIAWIRINWKATAADNKPLVVHISTEGSQRSLAQNRAYWSLLQEISDHAWANGKKFSRDAWHGYFGAMFLPKIEGPDGSYPVSTSSLSVKQMSEYLHSIEAYACDTLGLEI